MTVRLIVSIVALAASASLWTGCASSPETAETAHYSGFLGDYSQLEETTDAAGDEVQRYVNPRVESGAYSAVMLEPTQFYPAPQPTDQVSAATLEEIRTYVDDGLRQSLGSQVKLVSQPGPGVLVIKPAITAVVTETPGLRPYQYLPIAFVATTVAGRGKEAAVNMEIDVVDSLSGERMGASVRRGVGEKLADDDGMLTVAEVQPLLDRWIDTGSSFVATEMGGSSYAAVESSTEG